MTASFSISSTVNGSGSRSDGLGHSASTPGTLSGARYSVVNDPGAGFTLPQTCSPAANATGQAKPGSSGAVSAGVTYKAVATPVVIALTGITTDSSNADGPAGDGQPERALHGRRSQLYMVHYRVSISLFQRL